MSIRAIRQLWTTSHKLIGKSSAVNTASVYQATRQMSQDAKILRTEDVQPGEAKWLKLQKIQWQDQEGKEVGIIYAALSGTDRFSGHGRLRIARRGPRAVWMVCSLVECNAPDTDQSRRDPRASKSPLQTSLNYHHRAVQTAGRLDLHWWVYYVTHTDSCRAPSRSN